MIMFEFSDQIVLVGGASGNLGQAVAQAFHAAGASLVLLDRKPDQLSKLFPELAGTTEHLLPGAVDATDTESVTSAVQAAINRFGRIDVLANTVGGYRAGTPVHETPLETLDFMLNLNTRTAFILSQAVVPHMLAQGSGKIVHVAAQSALKGGANSYAYSVSKCGIVRLVESMAAELGQSGVNVNCVLPGTIDTPQNRQAMPKADHSRWTPPEAIADVMLFLASPAARAVSGAAVPVDGSG
jgi:NAD(P)-dependent dehydrogenase (short-subunit alcohol dehydrogenase family)